MRRLIRFLLFIGFFQIQGLAFAQSVESKNGYIFTFNPVYASGLIDISYVSLEDTYFVISDTSLKIDSLIADLTTKNYSSKKGILDTLKQKFKVYNIIDGESKKKRRKINTLLSDRNRYGRRFLIPLNDEIKKYSSLVGYVISRYIRLEGKIKYMVFNEECGSFPDECKVIILNL